MNSEEWRRVQAGFEAALESGPGPERERILAAACGGDPTLRQEVESLLKAHAGARGTEPLLEGSLSPLVRSLAEAGSRGRRIGPYRILHEIGAGGMGAVYLAERDDDQFHQVVALKVARADVSSPDLLARFLAERQILANLNHPNVARLLDGGVSAEGSPYFAMEYVEGESIDRYCEAQRASVAERLRLFLEVCEGVQHAHRNLVVHRDLKPSNILVTRDGTARLLDFGIAKLLTPDDPSDSAGAPRTLTWATPAYASPEQIAGRPITTASDVYSLGVILYELLCGRLPYDLEDRSPAEVEKIVFGPAPPRPSAACGRAGATGGTRSAATRAAEKLRRRLNGDLDLMVMKALQKEPERRYRSVEALADDIRRHLAGLPVRARPDSVAYRGRKFVGRHRMAAAAALLLFLSLAAGLGGTAWQARQAGRERDRARLSAAKAERINAFLQEMLSSADPEHSHGPEVTVREVLDDAASTVNTELADQPEVQAAVRSTIGKAYLNLGLYEQARDHLEAALATRERLFGERSAEAAESLDELGKLELSLGNFAAAESTYRKALAVTREALGESHPDVGTALNNLAVVLQNEGRLDEAALLLRDSLQRCRSVSGSNHLLTAAAAANLGQCLESAGDYEEAEALAREAVRIYRAQPGGPTLDLSRALNNLALLLRKHGLLEEAEALIRESLTIKRSLYGDDQPEVARTLGNLAFILRDEGKPAEAESLLWIAIRIYEAKVGPDYPDLAAPLSGLGAILVQRGQVQEAEPLLRRSLALQRNAFPPRDPRIAMVENTLGAALTHQGRFQEAESLLTRSNAVIQESGMFGESHRTESLRRLTDLYRRWGRPEAAAAVTAAAGSALLSASPPR